MTIYCRNIKFQWTSTRYIGDKYHYLVILVNYQYFVNFSVFIGILLIFRLYFAIFWDDQHNQTPTKRFFIHCANRCGKVAPCYISCSKYIYIYTQIHHINIILKKCFKEQINYNYFIIKWKFCIYLNTKNIKIIVIIFFIMFLISVIY